VALAPDAFVETDASGVVTGWNASAEDLLGWAADDVLGTNVADFLVPPDTTDRFLLDPRRSEWAEEGLPLTREVRLLHRQGHEVHVAGPVYVHGSGRERRIGGFLRDQSREQAALEAQQALAHAYLHDALTGLPNRTMFTYRLAYALAKWQGATGGVAVLVLDLDRFKTINDGLGHEVGDEVLVAVAGRLLDAGATAQVIARLGGDEFLVLFDGNDAQDAAVSFSRRVLAALTAPIEVGGAEVFITASIGIAGTTTTVGEATSLLSNADAAMYQAKQRGGGTTEVFGEAIRVKVLDRMTTEHSLHRALERDELQLYYQPVVDIAHRSGHRVVALEALLRWDHPEHGLTSPGRFIPVAEDSGLIIPIGAWVLHEACRQLAQWERHRRGRPPWSVEVNLSARQIDHTGVISTVEKALSLSGVDPAQLTLEITESALMKDAASALAVLKALKGLGVTLAIDDFGTGYSSLSYLQRFPLDILKIDRTFVRELGSGGDGAEIVAAVVNLAHALDLQVVAEGVETERQLIELRRLGCDFAQGYLFSRPFPPHQLVEQVPQRIGA
jgi:diguanylate cyclase (GGDEF)-like protein/PAS domain S-box-containing protein